MTREQWFEKAQAYFNGDMSPEEARLFETETAAIDDLSQLMQLWKTSDAEAIVYEQNRSGAADFIKTHQKLKSEFLGVEEKPSTFTEMDVDSASPARRKLKWVAIAAGVAGIIILVGLLRPSNRNNARVADRKLKADSSNFVPPIISPDTPAVRSPQNDNSPAKAAPDHYDAAVLYAQAFLPDHAPENPNGPLDDAFFYYASEQYEKAIMAIDSAGNKQLKRGSFYSALTGFYARYYKALSLMALGREAEAIPLLKESAQHAPDRAIKAKVRWYLALAQLKESRSSSMNILRSLVTDPDSGPYRRKAENLLAALKR